MRETNSRLAISVGVLFTCLFSSPASSADAQSTVGASFTDPAEIVIIPLTWVGRSTETSDAVPAGSSVGSQVDAGLDLPLDPSQTVFDNGLYTQNRAVTPPESQWASWPNWHQGCRDTFEVRHFRATFSLPVELGTVFKLILFSPYYTAHGNIIPINDNVYVFLNRQLIGKKGTSYGAMNAGMGGNAPFANETDGWFQDGSLGSDRPLELLPGLNVLDFVTEESCFWGGMGRLDLKIIPSSEAPCADDVTSQFRISRHAIIFDPATQLFVQRVRLTNISADPISDPVYLVLDNLGRKTRLANQNGVTTCAAPLGSPYRRANLGTDKVLSPGEAGIVLLKFQHRLQRPISYSPRVLAGDNR